MAMESDPALTRAALRFVDLGHCALAYREVGSGPPLILVHGYPLSGLTFRHLVPGLAEHFTCYVPDLPGLGETRWTDRTDFMFAAQAETLKAFIDKLQLPSYAVVAHDTGGTIARRLGVIDRGRLTRMALIGTEIPGHRPPWIPLFQKIANPNQTRTFKFLMSQRWFRHSSAGFGGCFTDRSLIEGAFFELMLKPMLADTRRISGQTRYLMGIDWKLVDALEIDHAKITAPVLLVWGEDDPVFPVEVARPMAAQLANCAGFVTVPHGKLFVHEEMPDVVLPILLDFLLRDREPIDAENNAVSRPVVAVQS
jgi:pimeloyl-ACP methyl ester carboxylesterase